MAACNQDFALFSGDALIPVYTVTDGNGDPIPLGGGNTTEIIWTAQRDLDAGTPILLTKTLTAAGGITIVGDGSTGKFAVALEPADTAALSGGYWTKAVIFDQDGNPTTVATGRMSVRPKPVATYSGDPANNTRDFIRALVGDTDMDHPMFSDQIYDSLTKAFGGPLYVAAQACRMIAQRYSGKASKRVGDLSITYGELSANFLKMASEYQARADMQGSSGIIYASGISKSDMAQYRPFQNPDVVGAFTTLKAFDNDGATSGGFYPLDGSTG